MIVTLPDPTIPAPQPPSPFRWSWPKFFTSRKSYRLTAQDVAELEAIELELSPWARMGEKLSEYHNPQGRLHDRAMILANAPTDENLAEFLKSRWVPPYFGMQLSMGVEFVSNRLAVLREEKLRPVVARHLQKVAKLLEAEISEQTLADSKAVARLGGAVEEIGRSEPCRILHAKLTGINSDLANGAWEWRIVLGEYLP